MIDKKKLDREGMKKFKVQMDDSGTLIYYSIWHIPQNGSTFLYRCAEFYGKNCRRYAYEHCKKLNALPEKDKP